MLTRVPTRLCTQSIIVSLPIDLSGPGDEELAKLERRGVRGHYAIVETLEEQDDDATEWRMASSGTPGGRIPNFVAESTMASKIAQVCTLVSCDMSLRADLRLKDVPHFIAWLRKRRNIDTNATLS